MAIEGEFDLFPAVGWADDVIADAEGVAVAVAFIHGVDGGNVGIEFGIQVRLFEAFVDVAVALVISLSKFCELDGIIVICCRDDVDHVVGYVLVMPVDGLLEGYLVADDEDVGSIVEASVGNDDIVELPVALFVFGEATWFCPVAFVAPMLTTSGSVTFCPCKPGSAPNGTHTFPGSVPVMSGSLDTEIHGESPPSSGCGLALQTLKLVASVQAKEFPDNTQQPLQH